MQEQGTGIHLILVLAVVLMLASSLFSQIIECCYKYLHRENQASQEHVFWLISLSSLISLDSRIYAVNREVVFLLLERVSHWHDQQCLGDIFSEKVSISR